MTPSVQESFELIGQDSYNYLKKVEGILIKSYQLKHGKLPQWNKIGGSVEGQRAAVIGNYEIVDLFSNQNNSLLVSRYSLRELSEDATALYYEESMHAIRMYMFAGANFDQAVGLFCMTHKYAYERMLEEGYFSHLIRN
ncbi:hypothetical protein [Paenibacillus terrae]|uniref:hypothetical protein n=1 Tax=Paenibacillus terrae TaxID=159743 RepID=UPI000AA5E258|nr:hypothetical protein [Paenibacillus terrae]